MDIQFSLTLLFFSHDIFGFIQSRLSIYGGDKNFKVWHYKKLLIFKLYTTFNLSYKVGRRFKQNFEGAIVQNNVNFPHAFFIRHSIISTPESLNLPTPFWKPNAQLVCSRKKTMGYVSHYILMECNLFLVFSTAFNDSPPLWRNCHKSEPSFSSHLLVVWFQVKGGAVQITIW